MAPPIVNALSEVIVVTGCDSGFGNQCAKRLATEGWCVCAGVFTDDGVAELSKLDNILPAKLDVTSDESVEKFCDHVKKVCKEHGDNGLHGLVNNAGIAPTGYVEWAKLSDLKMAMEINVYGQIRMVKSCLPELRKAQGRVVNVASILGRLAFGGAPWYSCTKHAVEGWSDSFRREMRPFGVTVSIVEPGFFKTPMVGIEQYSRALNVQWDNLPEEAQKAYGKQTLTGYIENVKDQIEQLADPDTGKVVQAMVSALTDKYAKVRYPIGGSARWLFLPISHMPVWMADGILSGMNQKYKPAGTVARQMPRRMDIVVLWVIIAPYIYFMLSLINFGKLESSAIAFAIAWCLSWTWS